MNVLPFHPDPRRQLIAQVLLYGGTFVVVAVSVGLRHREKINPNLGGIPWSRWCHGRGRRGGEILFREVLRGVSKSKHLREPIQGRGVGGPSAITPLAAPTSRRMNPWRWSLLNPQVSIDS
jgi:hypothetical protein